jgi:hypothetical protein
MTQHSQNGWPVLISSQLTWFTAAGERFAAGNSDVAYVAAYLINRFNSEVEPIEGKTLDDWSWSSRKVRGSATVISNHASATAWDLNALKHPRGVKGTFSAAKIAAVHKILSGIVDNSGHKVFRWGNDYLNATIDSMHYEINVNASQVKQARARLVKLEEEADMKWTDKVALTAVDAKIWGKQSDGKPYKAGDLVSFGAMVRYPTLARKTDAELEAFVTASAKRDAAMSTQLTALAAAVAALASGSSAEVTKAFTDGVSSLQAAAAKIDADAAGAAAASDAEINADAENMTDDDGSTTPDATTTPDPASIPDPALVTTPDAATTPDPAITPAPATAPETTATSDAGTSVTLPDDASAKPVPAASDAH